MPDDKNIGIITEQGFVAGEGLGFKPVSESDLYNKAAKPDCDENEKKGNENNKKP